jgi:hypothetical protein
MSLSLPGAPGVSMARRSMLRHGRTARRSAPGHAVAPTNGGRLGELAEALRGMEATTGLAARDIATRLVEPLDASTPVRGLDVFAAGRVDLVTAYLEGTLDGAGLLTAWRRG